jgi:CBS domain-containing protein
MQVRDIMSSPAITVTADAEIRTVARLMREHQFSGVPVVDDNGKLLGAITELALIRRNAPLKKPQYIAVLSAYIPINLDDHRDYQRQLKRALALNAGELMTERVQTVTADSEIETALELMLDPEITFLPVVEDDRVVGVVTRTDLVRLIESLEMAEDT